MSKIVKNTTGSDVVLDRVGYVIPASSQHTIEVQEHLLWGNVDAISELTPHITGGTLVVNDGVQDLSVSDAINFLKHPDYAFNQRFQSEPERNNGFVSKTTQEAIEEAATGAVVSTSPTTTVGAVTAVAYTAVLAAGTAYKFTAEVEAHRTDVAGEEGAWQTVQKVRRLGAAIATLNGHTFQELAQRDDASMDVYWDVSGNQVQLKVVGVAGKTIKWQPRVVYLKVS